MNHDAAFVDARNAAGQSDSDNRCRQRTVSILQLLNS
jgi:hypothetical protein